MQNKKKFLAIFIPIAVFAFGAVYFAKAAAVVYPVSSLASNTKISIETRAVKFENGKWTYNFSWERVQTDPNTLPPQGKITIAPATNENLPVVTLDPAEPKSVPGSPLVVQLDPATRYVFKYYVAPGSSCNPNDEDDPECKTLLGGVAYFNTRDENGNIMATSQIPASRGGTKAGTTADQPLYISNGSLSSTDLIRNICDILLLLVAKLPAGTNTDALVSAVSSMCRVPAGGLITTTPVVTTPTVTTGTTAAASASNTANVAACQVEVNKYKKFDTLSGVSPHFSVSSSLAQDMKAWKRCHYSSNYGTYVDSSGKAAFLIPIDQPIKPGDPTSGGMRARAQECIDLAKEQGARLGFDEVRCSYGEYCGLGDGIPDGLCSYNERFMGSSASCTLREGNIELFAGEAFDIVGNDYGPGSVDSRPQGWFAWLNSFNKEIAKKELNTSWEAWYDAGKNLYRNVVQSASECLTKLPAACNNVINVTARTTSKTTAEVTWQAPSTVSSVNIYLVSPGRVGGHLNDLHIEATVGQGIASRTGLNTYTFSIPLETTLPVPSAQNSSSWLYGLALGSSIDSLVSNSVLSTGIANTGSSEEDPRFMFVRVEGNNGLFGESNGIGLNGQNGTPDYGTASNPPPTYWGGSSYVSCESALPTNIAVNTITSNLACDPGKLTNDSYQLGVFASRLWGPGMGFSNAGVVLRVAEDNGGAGEIAVKTGCPGNSCVLKVDDLWHDMRTVNQGGGTSELLNNIYGNFPIENLKPGTKYWFRTAAVCNLGQANQVVGGEEVWSCTTPGGSTSCTNECNAVTVPGSNNNTRCMPGTHNVRQYCGYYDTDSCLDWGDGTNSVTGFKKGDLSCP